VLCNVLVNACENVISFVTTDCGTVVIMNIVCHSHCNLDISWFLVNLLQMRKFWVVPFM